MNQYETVFILTPVLSDVQMKEAVEKFTNLLKEQGAEIVNEENVTVANSVLNVPLERGKNTVWTGEFLTGDDQGGQGGDEPGEDEGGIGIDPDYDNETDLGVTVE